MLISSENMRKWSFKGGIALCGLRDHNHGATEKINWLYIFHEGFSYKGSEHRSELFKVWLQQMLFENGSFAWNGLGRLCLNRGKDGTIKNWLENEWVEYELLTFVHSSEAILEHSQFINLSKFFKDGPQVLLFQISWYLAHKQLDGISVLHGDGLAVVLASKRGRPKATRVGGSSQSNNHSIGLGGLRRGSTTHGCHRVVVVMVVVVWPNLTHHGGQGRDGAIGDRGTQGSSSHAELGGGEGYGRRQRGGGGESQLFRRWTPAAGSPPRQRSDVEKASRVDNSRQRWSWQQRWVTNTNYKNNFGTSITRVFINLWKKILL